MYVRSISSVIANNRKYQKVTIPDSKVDTTTIKVSVQDSISDTTGITNTWTAATNLSSVTAGSRAYFVEQDYTGNYSMNFGDGVFGATRGRKLGHDFISVNKRTSDKWIGLNDAISSLNSFTYLTGNTVDTISPASGGALPQTVESIQQRCSKTYAAQNRAITSSDFEALVESNFSGFTSVFAYGGEEENPPQYGRVFISLKPQVNQVITDALKSEIERFLKTKCSLRIEPVVLSPDLAYLQVSTNFTFDQKATPLNSAAMTSLIVNLINSYVAKLTL